MSALVTLTGDGTWYAPVSKSPGAAGSDGSGSSDGADGGAGHRLEALLRLRGLLGDDLEDQITTRMTLPLALGTESADQILPQSLTLLAGTTGDLASYGWRIGPGAGRSWHRARELRTRLLDAARIALHGLEGPLRITALGPLTLSAATFLDSGERTLSDRGALRDLPQLLAQGIAEHLEAVREHVPGVDLELLVRDGDALAMHRGQIPTPSGYRRYAAVPAAEIGTLWRDLLDALRDATGLPAEAITLAPGPDAALHEAARTAGARRIALSPDTLGAIATRSGHAAWEALAGAHESGIATELILDPRRIERTLESVARSWHELGWGSRELAGFTLLAHRSGRSADPAAEQDTASLVHEADLQALLRAAPGWAARIEA